MGVTQKGFTERVNLGSVCYHILGSVKNASRCLYSQKIPFQNHDSPVPTSGLCLHPHDTSFHPPLVTTLIIPIVQKTGIKWVAHQPEGLMNREQDKHSARSTLLKHLIYIYREGN